MQGTSFHYLIKEARNRLGYKQQECADRVSIAFPDSPMTRSAWGQLEKHPSQRVNPRTVERVAVGLNLPIQTVAAWANYAMPEDANEYDEFKLLLRKNITGARESRMPKEDLAIRIGVLPAILADYEAGTRDIPPLDIKKIAIALGVTVDSLFGVSDSDMTLSEVSLEKHEDSRLLREIYEIARKFDQMGQQLSLCVACDADNTLRDTAENK